MVTAREIIPNPGKSSTGSGDFFTRAQICWAQRVSATARAGWVGRPYRGTQGVPPGIGRFAGGGAFCRGNWRFVWDGASRRRSGASSGDGTCCGVRATGKAASGIGQASPESGQGIVQVQASVAGSGQDVGLVRATRRPGQSERVRARHWPVQGAASVGAGRGTRRNSIGSVSLTRLTPSGRLKRGVR